MEFSHYAYICVIVIIISIFEACAMTTDIPVGRQTAQTLETEITKTVHVQYLLYLPADYEKQDEDWPLILFLHGAGERGDSLAKVKVHGPPKHIEKGEKFPFIIVSPQCLEDQRWSTEDLDALLNDVCRHYRIDEDRIYVTGLSMGGHGTWAMAIEYPDRFAAIAPICGRGKPDRAELIKHIPAWVFHGARDAIVPLEKSQDMVEALKNAGGNVKFTIYPEAGHDSWTETYNNPELFDWFLSHKRKK